MGYVGQARMQVRGESLKRGSVSLAASRLLLGLSNADSRQMHAQWQLSAQRQQMSFPQQGLRSWTSLATVVLQPHHGALLAPRVTYTLPASVSASFTQ